MDDDLFESLLSYECPFTGAKRVAGLGTVETEHGKCHGCSGWEMFRAYHSNFQHSINAVFLSMEPRRLKPTCETGSMLPPSTPPPVLSIRPHIDDPLGAAENPFFDWMWHTSKSVFVQQSCNHIPTMVLNKSFKIALPYFAKDKHWWWKWLHGVLLPWFNYRGFWGSKRPGEGSCQIVQDGRLAHGNPCNEVIPSFGFLYHISLYHQFWGSCILQKYSSKTWNPFVNKPHLNVLPTCPQRIWLSLPMTLMLQPLTGRLYGLLASWAIACGLAHLR